MAGSRCAPGSRRTSRRSSTRRTCSRGSSIILHGTRDDRIEVERARESRESLRPYGVALTYREFDMGHEIRPDALRVLQQWLNDKARKGE